VHNANIANQYYQAFAYLYAYAGGTLPVAQQIANKLDVAVYPNPATNYIEIAGVETGAVAIYSMSGVRLFDSTFTRDTQISIGFVVGYLFVENYFRKQYHSEEIDGALKLK